MLKQHGGHNKGKPSPVATGSGPLWEARQQRGWTRSELARRSGVGLTTIRNCEKAGTMPANSSTRAALERALREESE